MTEELIKDINKQLVNENRLLKAKEKALGERVLQLEKDKGNLIDRNRELKERIGNICSQYVSNELAYKIKEIIMNI